METQKRKKEEEEEESTKTISFRIIYMIIKGFLQILNNC